MSACLLAMCPCTRTAHTAVNDHDRCSACRLVRLLSAVPGPVLVPGLLHAPTAAALGLAALLGDAEVRHPTCRPASLPCVLVPTQLRDQSFTIRRTQNATRNGCTAWWC